ncbi:MAG: DUF4124 domain-containing protein [Desulfobacterales bacterium]|nr:DUF4124 domain-containing protein [Desulfobacterales bacterium]
MNRSHTFFLSLAFFLAITIVPCAIAEFYSYVDENGVTHFTDNYANVPQHLAEETNAHAEDYDNLTPIEREKQMAKDRLEASRLEKQREKDLRKARSERKRSERKARRRASAIYIGFGSENSSSWSKESY